MKAEAALPLRGLSAPLPRFAPPPAGFGRARLPAAPDYPLPQLINPLAWISIDGSVIRHVSHFLRDLPDPRKRPMHPAIPECEPVSSSELKADALR